MLRILLVLFFGVVGVSALSQKYPMVKYGTEQGLPQSQVTDFAQDDKGYLWISTLGGLARFNGTKFITYSSNDGLLNNRVTALEYFDGTLWVGHDGGIAFMDNNAFRSIEFQGDGNDRSRKVSKIIKFKNKVIVCSIGGGLFEKKGDQLVKIPLANENYERIRGAHVYDGKLYLATRDGILVSQDARNFGQLEEFGDVSFSGVTGSKNEMIFSSFSNGVYIKNMQTGELRHFDAASLKYNVNGCFVDRDNGIWLSSNFGVVHITPNRRLQFFDESNGLPNNTISGFYHDDADNIWIGSSGKGMFRFPSSDFKYYDQSTGFPSDLYLGGFQDRRGDYYFSTYDAGVFKRSKEGETASILDQKVAIWASLGDLDGKHWFGATGFLAEVDMNGDVTLHTDKENENIPGWKITALCRIDGSSMYVGGNGGVALYRNGEFEKLSGKNNDLGTVRDFEILNGEVYCATNLGLFVYRNGKFSIVGDVKSVVYNLEKDTYNALWYGTEEGLFRMVDEKSEQVELLGDPASNFIDFMNYKDGEMFIGSNNGLFVISNLGEPAPNIKRYGIWDGVVDLETNLNSGFFDNKGDFWFGTASGLVWFKPDNSEGENARPKVNLVSILLNYESFDYKDFSDVIKSDGLPGSLTLPFSKNNIIFELDAVSLDHQKGLNYQFWLEGLSDDWSPLSGSPTLTFTSLPAGYYVLHVRAVDLEGQFSDELQFSFTINAPFYRTWWFILLCTVLVSGILLLIFRLRIRRIANLNEKEKLEYKSRLLTLEQKSMNASMNRHFIFNSLNSIQYFINTQDKLSANKYLTNFAKLIRKNLDSATAEGNVITLGEELERLELYLSLESMRFKDRFDYEISAKGVDTESVLIPPMLMQPFIENSIIHGILPNEKRKGLIKIDIEEKGDYLNVSIEDNGIGINKSLSSKLAMDGDHKSQGMEITSKRIELIQKIANNGISLEGPSEIKDENGLINGTYVLIKIPVVDLEI